MTITFPSITYVNESTKIHVEPLANQLGAPILVRPAVSTPAMLEAVF